MAYRALRPTRTPRDFCPKHTIREKFCLCCPVCGERKEPAETHPHGTPYAYVCVREQLRIRDGFRRQADGPG